jgi:hypothetical protein
MLAGRKLGLLVVVIVAVVDELRLVRELLEADGALVLLLALLLELLLVLLRLRLLLDGVLSRELGLEVPLAEASLLSNLGAAVGVLALLGLGAPVRVAEASLLSLLLPAVRVLARGPCLLLLLSLRFLAAPLPRLAREAELFLILLLVLHV